MSCGLFWRAKLLDNKNHHSLSQNKLVQQSKDSTHPVIIKCIQTVAGGFRIQRSTFLGGTFLFLGGTASSSQPASSCPSISLKFRHVCRKVEKLRLSNFLSTFGLALKIHFGSTRSRPCRFHSADWPRSNRPRSEQPSAAAQGCKLLKLAQPSFALTRLLVWLLGCLPVKNISFLWDGSMTRWFDSWSIPQHWCWNVSSAHSEQDSFVLPLVESSRLNWSNAE